VLRVLRHVIGAPDGRGRQTDNPDALPTSQTVDYLECQVAETPARRGDQFSLRESFFQKSSSSEDGGPCGDVD
jgi:hypothetical protein